MGDKKRVSDVLEEMDEDQQAVVEYLVSCAYENGKAEGYKEGTEYIRLKARSQYGIQL